MKTTRAESRWRSLIREQEKSGLTVREFAARRGIAAGTLFWWRSRLRSRQRSQLVAVEVVDHEAKDAAVSGMFELGIDDRLTLRISAGFDAGELRRLVQALRC